MQEYVISEGHFSPVSEHLWTMPCQEDSLQCIVWTFGERGGRGGSTVFTTEWDYSARMQPACVSERHFSLPGGTFLSPSRGTVANNALSNVSCSSVQSSSVRFELCKTMHYICSRSGMMCSVVTFHASKSVTRLQE